MVNAPEIAAAVARDDGRVRGRIVNARHAFIRGRDGLEDLDRRVLIHVPGRLVTFGGLRRLEPDAESLLDDFTSFRIHLREGAALEIGELRRHAVASLKVRCRSTGTTAARTPRGCGAIPSTHARQAFRRPRNARPWW